MLFRKGDIIALLEEVRDILLLQSKEVLSIKDFCTFSGFSSNYVYSLVEKKAITFFKPMGKTIFFRREDVVNFLTSNKVDSKDAIQQKALQYFITSKKSTL